VEEGGLLVDVVSEAESRMMTTGTLRRRVDSDGRRWFLRSILLVLVVDGSICNGMEWWKRHAYYSYSGGEEADKQRANSVWITFLSE
jgi:hypothetical protein